MSDTTLTLNVKLEGREVQAVTITPGVLSLWELNGPEPPKGVEYRSVVNLTERTVDLLWVVWKSLRSESEFEDWLLTVEEVTPEDSDSFSEGGQKIDPLEQRAS